MPGGLTLHRGFGLPLNMNAQSKSSFQKNLQSVMCQPLRQTDVFLIDEIPMIVKYAINICHFLMVNFMLQYREAATVAKFQSTSRIKANANAI